MVKEDLVNLCDVKFVYIKDEDMTPASDQKFSSSITDYSRTFSPSLIFTKKQESHAFFSK